MPKIKSYAELVSFRNKIRLKDINEENHDSSNSVTQIRIGMSTCGIASGAKEIMKVFTEECEFQAIDVDIKQTGCLGYCYAEPIVEVKVPGKEPRVFGYVDKFRAKQIIDNYIVKGEITEGEIEIAFKTINN
jgi:NADP-reducing hydrogenase subunit HndB